MIYCVPLRFTFYIGLPIFRKYTLGGAYRKMLEVPSDLSWRVMRYNERFDELIQCDVDEMRGLPAPKEDPGTRLNLLRCD